MVEVKPFLLLLHLIVVTPEGSIASTIDRFYTPDLGACEKTAEQLKATLNFTKVKRYKKGKKNGRVKKTVLISFAKVICVPMRGVQHMPGDKK